MAIMEVMDITGDTILVMVMEADMEEVLVEATEEVLEVATEEVLEVDLAEVTEVVLAGDLVEDLGNNTEEILTKLHNISFNCDFCKYFIAK